MQDPQSSVPAPAPRRSSSTWVAIAAGFMLLFPPFFFTYNGTSIDAGYGFLFIPPKKGTLAASINWSRLLAQWLLIAVVAYVVGIRREGDALRK